MIAKPFQILAFLSLCFVFETKANSSCNELERSHEETFLHQLKETSVNDVSPCFQDDAVLRDVMNHEGRIVNGLLSIKGLPFKIWKRLSKLRYEEARFYVVDFPLCLQSQDCDQYSLLSAKNYKFRKKGFVFVNRDRWLGLTSSEKHSLIMHELLSVLGFEKNSYTYSSLLQVEMRCETVANQFIASSVCNVWIITHNKEIIPL